MGLLRTGYMMLPGRILDEQEQYFFYCSCLAAAQGRQVTCLLYTSGDHEVGVLAVEPGEPGQAGVMAGQVFAGAVSYTHLDVYKRQQFRCVGDPQLRHVPCKGQVCAVCGQRRLSRP